LYSRGTAVPRDESKAIDLVEQALKLNAPHAFYTMGVMLQQGIGVRQDEAAALSYFRRAADLGNRYGQQAVGEAIRNVFAKQLEPERTRGYAIAVQMLECALSQDMAEAGYTLGWHFLDFEEDASIALGYFQRAAALGDAKSIYMLYSIFREGSNGIEKDPQRAACYDKLWYEAKAEPGRKFPDIDRLCPLPPPPV
ncbi:tetratricopeptide repeat protein, partial [Pseudomonas aeruginosa]